MSDQNQEIAELEQLNRELARSLKRCRKLLFDYHSQLAANINMPELLDEEAEESAADRDPEEAEASYFAKRERREREMSRLATNGNAAAAHLDLADRYEALAMVFGAKSVGRNATGTGHRKHIGRE